MTTTTFPALDFANAWLNVSLCSGNDENRPVLHRTVLIEQFNTGVQLVATDSFMIFGCFVPTARNDLTNPPSIDEAPTGARVVMDLDKRMRGLMSFMRKEGLAAEKNNERCDISLSFKTAEAGATPTLDPSLDRTACIVETANERLVLPIYEGEFPNWRPLIQSELDAVDTIGLSPALLGRFGKLVGLNHTARLRLSGEHGLIQVDFPGAETYLFGGLMPATIGGELE